MSTGNIEFIGTAVISGGNIVSVAITNPGSGYTSTNQPFVVFDDPLSYSNMDLVYSSSSVTGFGTHATANVVVGQGSSVIDFEITNPGSGYTSTNQPFVVFDDPLSYSNMDLVYSSSSAAGS